MAGKLASWEMMSSADRLTPLVAPSARAVVDPMEKAWLRCAAAVVALPPGGMRPCGKYRIRGAGFRGRCVLLSTRRLGKALTGRVPHSNANRRHVRSSTPCLGAWDAGSAAYASISQYEVRVQVEIVVGVLSVRFKGEHVASHLSCRHLVSIVTSTFDAYSPDAVTHERMHRILATAGYNVYSRYLPC